MRRKGIGLAFACHEEIAQHMLLVKVLQMCRLLYLSLLKPRIVIEDITMRTLCV